MSVSNFGTSFLSPSITYAGKQPFYGAGSNTPQISTFQQLFTSSITGNTASFSSINSISALIDSISSIGIDAGIVNTTLASVSSMAFNEAFGNQMTISTISSTNISCSTITVLGDLDLNGNDLTTSSTFPFELLLNGIPIATTSNISSLSDWAYYPAVSSINAGGNYLSNVPAIEMSGANGFITGVSSINNLPYPPVPAPTGVTSFNTLTGAVTISAGPNITLSPLGNDIAISAAGAGVQDTITGVNTFMTSVGLGSGQIADADITAGGGLGGKISLVANAGDGLISGGNINMTANGGNAVGGLFGAITMTANPGTASGITTGGSINIVANSGTSASNLTSKISLSAGGLNLYSGVTSPFASLFGYTYLNASLGISLVAGAFTSGLQAPGTVYLYGATGITLGSDVYANRFFPTWDTVSPPANLVISGRTTVTGDAYVALSNVSTIAFDSATSRAITGLSTINNLPYPPPPSAGVTPYILTGTTAGAVIVNAPIGAGNPFTQNVFTVVSQITFNLPAVLGATESVYYDGYLFTDWSANFNSFWGVSYTTNTFLTPTDILGSTSVTANALQFTNFNQIYLPLNLIIPPTNITSGGTVTLKIYCNPTSANHYLTVTPINTSRIGIALN